MTDRPLPETIPAGEYVLLLSKPEGEIVTATVSYHRDDWWLNHRDDWWLNVNSGMALITEAQARHLLAMPGRPHDDRLGGGALPCWCPPDECWLPTGTTRIAGGCRAGRAGEAPDATPGTAAPHGDRLDGLEGQTCPSESHDFGRDEHCTHWRDQDKPCCWCGYDGDDCAACVASVGAPVSDQIPTNRAMTDQPDPYADLRRTASVVMAVAPDTTKNSPADVAARRAARFRALDDFHEAANPDTIDRLLAERDALAAERPNLVALLAELVDFMGEPCRYDHHDRCQAHMLHAADECPVAQATAILLREERP